MVCNSLKNFETRLITILIVLKKRLNIVYFLLKVCLLKKHQKITKYKYGKSSK